MHITSILSRCFVSTISIPRLTTADHTQFLTTEPPGIVNLTFILKISEVHSAGSVPNHYYCRARRTCKRSQLSAPHFTMARVPPTGIHGVGPLNFFNIFAIRDIGTSSVLRPNVWIYLRKYRGRSY